MKNKIRLPLQVISLAGLVMFLGVASADAKAHHPNRHHQLLQNG